MNYIFKILSTVLLLSFFTGVYANPYSNNQYYKFQNGIFLNMAMSTGILNSSAQELVYKDNIYHSLLNSKLDWQIKYIPILNFNLSLQKPSLGEINIRGFTSIKKGSGYMDDYDWLIEGQSAPSRHSWHPNTDVNYANEFDANIKIWLAQKKSFKAGAIFGYQRNNFSWTAIGGEYSYENGSNKGIFENEPVIAYKQDFYMAYIGLSTQLQLERFELNTQFKYGPFVYASDHDQHFKKDTEYYEKGHTIYYGILLDVGFYVTKNLKLFSEWSYNDYQTGLVNLKEIKNGIITYYNKLGGISNKSNALSVGLKYTFSI